MHKAKCQNIVIATSSIFMSKEAKEQPKMSAFQPGPRRSMKRFTMVTPLAASDSAQRLNVKECQVEAGGRRWQQRQPRCRVQAQLV